MSDNGTSKNPNKPRVAKPKPAVQPQPKAAAASEGPVKVELSAAGQRKDMALTVRIEINLPSNGSQETYDNIFKSIRANLYV